MAIIIIRRAALFLTRNPLPGTNNGVTAVTTPKWLFSWRELSQRPEGSPSNWNDDIRPRADGRTPAGGPGIASDQHVRVINQHPGGGRAGGRGGGGGEDGVERAKERTKDAANTLADLAKEGTSKAIDAGLELGGFAKKTMDVAWDAAKDTANNLKDAVTGDDDDDDHHKKSKKRVFR